MGGPIVRTGTTPDYWENWDNIFGADAKKTAKKKTAKKKTAQAPSKQAKKAKKAKKSKKK